LGASENQVSPEIFKAFGLLGYTEDKKLVFNLGGKCYRF